jgi:anti-sigma factor RsiW
MDCADVREQILESFDEAAPAALPTAIEAHVRECSRCAAFAASMRGLDARLGAALVQPPMSPSFRTTLQARIGRERNSSRLDALPEILHLGSCAAVTVLAAALLPFDVPVTLAAGTAATSLSFVALFTVRTLFEALEQVDV